MTQKILIIALISLKFNAFSQVSYKEYYKQMSKAYTEITSNNFQNAITILDSTFSKFYPFPDDINALTKCYLSIGNRDKAYESMKLMILSGFKLESTLPLINSNTPYQNNKITTGSGDSILEMKLLNEYPILRKEYSKKINWEQNNYLSILTYFEVHTSLMRKKCSTCSDKLNNLITDYGMSTEKDMLVNLLSSNFNINRCFTDTWTSDEFIMLLIHSAQSLDNQKDKDFFFEQLLKHVDLGNLNNTQYALIFDNIRYRNKQGTLYGLQIQRNPKTGERECAKIEEITNVDVRRAEIGLPPLWVWCELHKINLPKEYQRK